MAISVSDTVDHVRALVADVNGARFSDDNVLLSMRLALSTMRRTRPDIFIEESMAVPSPTALSESLSIEAQYADTLANLTAARLLMQSTEYAEDGTAARLQALGLAQLVSGAA